MSEASSADQPATYRLLKNASRINGWLKKAPKCPVVKLPSALTKAL